MWEGWEGLCLLICTNLKLDMFDASCACVWMLRSVVKLKPNFCLPKLLEG